MQTKFPARIHVLLAGEAPIGLVIRRGPSKSVCTLLWDRNRDTFQLGQWMRGRIYERRCDLSPDGKYFIYFAMNGRLSARNKGSWTAIARVPYLKALTFLAKGDCWHGGGLFLSNRDYWLNDGYGHTELRTFKGLRSDLTYQPDTYYGGECLNVYYPRLQRDGWILRSKDHHGAFLFEKPLPSLWVLRKLAFAEVGAPPGRGCYWDAHELKHEPSGTVLAFPEWEWADLDRKRLVWAANGQLWTARLGDGKLSQERLLHDFNGMQFEAKPAPY
ncbi:MAG TPA: hypothetical protein VNZ22_07735 [Bacillota bacterium]|nr:hypothetical protein [Bacillota bacterium]